MRHWCQFDTLPRPPPAACIRRCDTKYTGRHSHGGLQLVLAYFDSEAAADQAASALKAWDKASEEVKLGNVGVLVKNEKGEVKQDKLGPRKTMKGAGIGLVLGIVAAPFTAGVSLVGTTAAGGVVGMLLHKGLPKEDVERIGRELEAGHAAVGALVEEGEAAQVTTKLTELGGKAEAHAVSAAALEEAETAVGAARARRPGDPGPRSVSALHEPVWCHDMEGSLPCAVPSGLCGHVRPRCLGRRSSASPGPR